MLWYILVADAYRLNSLVNHYLIENVKKALPWLDSFLRQWGISFCSVPLFQKVLLSPSSSMTFIFASGVQRFWHRSLFLEVVI